MERIARYAVALRVSDDDEIELLRQPLFAESAVAEIGIEVRDRQHQYKKIGRRTDAVRLPKH